MSRRLFSTATRSRTSFLTDISAFHAPAPSVSRSRAGPFIAATATTAAAVVANTPRLGSIARWYLPAMAALAVGFTFLPESLFHGPPPPAAKRTVTLDEATQHIVYSIAQQLDQRNQLGNPTAALTQEQKNLAMLNSYGDRSSLEELEKAIAGYGAIHSGAQDERKGTILRSTMLEDAFGSRSSLKQVKRAMSIYEVQ